MGHHSINTGQFSLGWVTSAAKQDETIPFADIINKTRVQHIYFHIDFRSLWPMAYGDWYLSHFCDIFSPIFENPFKLYQIRQIFFAIAVSKSVFFVIGLWGFYVTFRFTSLTSGTRKCYENRNVCVKFISNHILLHSLNINNSCTPWYSYHSDMAFWSPLQLM